ncbi:MAG TPA: hypothetical protein VMC06_10740 [Opitutaceae bacterium]|nr:hypothetical protein [Opitutaceae bacterium]
MNLANMPLTVDQFNDSWPAAAHESWLCRDAFHRFQIEGKRQIIANTFRLEPTRESNIAAYSAYADFIQHLHGTYMVLFEMEVYHGHIVAPKKGKEHVSQDNFLLNEADRRQDKNSKVPVPKELGNDIRDIRNRTNHVGHKRTDPKAAGQITLQEFYRKYHHPFVEVLYEQIASGYLDRHAANGKWDAIEGFSVIAGDAAKRLSGLETRIAYFSGILATGTSHIRLGLIDESSADRPSADPPFYDLPILGAPPWDAHESWKKGFFDAWSKNRTGGALSSRLGPASLLEGSQRPESIIALSGLGLDETRYVLRLDHPNATLEAIIANRTDMEACVREAGDYWRANLSGAHRALIQEQEERAAERERIRQANRASSRGP